MSLDPSFDHLLVHEDSVAIQVFKQNPGPIGMDFRFAVKLHAQLFHSLVVTEVIMGLESDTWVADTKICR